MNEALAASPELYLFAGFECVRQPDWKEHALLAKAPRTWGPDAVEKHVAKEMDRAEEEAHIRPLCGTVSKMVLLDRERKVQFSGDGPRGYCWLCSYLSERIRASNGDPNMTVFGLNVNARMHLAALGAAIGNCMPLSWGLLLNTFMHKPSRKVIETVDPVRLILGSDGDYDAKVGVLCRFIQTSEDPAYPDGVNTADEQANFAIDLVERFGLATPLF